MPLRTEKESWSPLRPGLLSGLEAFHLELVFKALADRTRIQMICLLLADEVMEVNQFQRDLQISQPLASHHLRRLVNAGILQCDREGRCSYYYITDGALKVLSALFDEAATNS